MSKRLYFMSGLSLKVVLDPSGTASWTPDDLIANAALATAPHRETSFIGRASADVSGTLAADILVKAGIDTTGLDRYSDVPSPLTLASGDAATIYAVRSAEAFNPVWPRFEDGDVMVWGGYFSLDPDVHSMMLDLLKYAAARRVKMVYVPYFTELQVPRVTRVMPLIFDNLELADVVIASTDTLKAIFGSDDMEAVYRNNINFYAPLLYAYDTRQGVIGEYTAGDSMIHPAAFPPAEVIASTVTAL